MVDAARFTINLRRPCLFPSVFANKDGVHSFAQMNLAMTIAFLSRKHTTPKGGFPMHT
jgi:hypothetical protein